MNKKEIQNFLEDKINNLIARVNLIILTQQEVDEISMVIRRPDEHVAENKRVTISGYYPGEEVFGEIKKVSGPAVLDISVSKNGYVDYLTIKKR